MVTACLRVCLDQGNPGAVVSPALAHDVLGGGFARAGLAGPGGSGLPATRIVQRNVNPAGSR